MDNNLTHAVRNLGVAVDNLSEKMDSFEMGASQEEAEAGPLIPRLLTAHTAAVERLTRVEQQLDDLAEAIDFTLDLYQDQKAEEAKQKEAVEEGFYVDPAFKEELVLRGEELEAALEGEEAEEIPLTEKMATTHTMARTLADELPKGLDAVVSGMENAPDDLS